MVLREANLDELRTSLTASELDLIVVPSVAPMPGHEHRIVDAEPLVLITPDTELPPKADAPADVPELAAKPLILLPDTCGLTTFTRDLLAEHHVPLQAYPGEASSYRVLEDWSRLGLGSALLPESKVSDPTTHFRRLRDPAGTLVELFYEAVWNPASPIAGELGRLADRLAEPAHSDAGS